MNNPSDRMKCPICGSDLRGEWVRVSYGYLLEGDGKRDVIDPELETMDSERTGHGYMLMYFWCSGSGNCRFNSDNHPYSIFDMDLGRSVIKEKAKEMLG